MLSPKPLLALLPIALSCIAAPNQEETEIPFTLSAPRMRVPKWSHGSLIVVLHHNTLDPQIWLIEPLRQRSLKFTIPGARKMLIADWDRGADGTIGIAGSVEYSDGRPSASFIAWISPDDPASEPQVVALPHYNPAHVAVAPDETIWTSGVKAFRAPGIDHVIRHFDRSGKLLGSFLPQSPISDPLTLGSVRTALRVSRDRVAWCSTTERDTRLVEISLNGNVLTDTSVSPPPGGQPPMYYIYGFAMQDEDAGGGVFVSGAWIDKTARANDGSSVERYGVFALDRANRAWKALPVDDPFAGVYGVEGDRLVLSGNKRIRFRKIDNSPR